MFDIRVGDMRVELDAIEADSIDACVTDPPYHLTSVVKRFGAEGAAPTKVKQSGVYERSSRGFMGQTWDGGDVAFQPETWARVLRVLKPGAHLLAFAASKNAHRLTCAIEDAGFEVRDTIMWLYGSGFPKSHNLDGDRVGWGTALKPAYEPIVVARKPLIGTVSENVAKHGTGALNIDGCRVGEFQNTVPSGVDRRNAALAEMGYRPGSYQMGQKTPNTPPGRWPANIIHDGSEEALAAFPDAKGQQGPISTTAPSEKTSNVYGRMKREGEASADSENDGAVGFKMKPGARRLDEGSAARFFYCAKASKSDREEGNTHPTVKPTDLMRYLCRLITPPGGIILDPFMGSGSTGKAAMLEGFRFIGCEMKQDYADIARARIAAALPEWLQ